MKETALLASVIVLCAYYALAAAIWNYLALPLPARG